MNNTDIRKKIIIKYSEVLTEILKKELFGLAEVVISDIRMMAGDLNGNR